MNILETKSVVKRLEDGRCPCCNDKLKFSTLLVEKGSLENNGMPYSSHTEIERHAVFCDRCGYFSPAVQIGLKIVPTDRIFEYDMNWDKKYQEENTPIFKHDKNKNPFDKKEKE